MLKLETGKKLGTWGSWLANALFSPTVPLCTRSVRQGSWDTAGTQNTYGARTVESPSALAYTHSVGHPVNGRGGVSRNAHAHVAPRRCGRSLARNLDPPVPKAGGESPTYRISDPKATLGSIMRQVSPCLARNLAAADPYVTTAPKPSYTRRGPDPGPQGSAWTPKPRRTQRASRRPLQ